MPKVNEMYPSNYLKASDVEDSDLVLTIKKCVQEKIGQGRDANDKWCLHFREEKKALVLNKTNTTVIAKLYGDDTDEWIGRQITLYATEVQFQGDMVEAIRVKGKVPKKPPKAEAAGVAADDEGGDDTPF